MEDIDELSRKFNESQNKNEIAEVIKELFDKDKIYMISDLSPEEIRLFTKISMIGKIKGITLYDDALEMFAQLVLSKNRSSRKELLEAIRGYMGQQGFFQRMNPANWGKPKM